MCLLVLPKAFWRAKRLKQHAMFAGRQAPDQVALLITNFLRRENKREKHRRSSKLDTMARWARVEPEDLIKISHTSTEHRAEQPRKKSHPQIPYKSSLKLEGPAA